MKTTLYPTFIYRVPCFHVKATLQDCWHELKEAIRLSSPDFYLQIKDVSVDGLEGLAPQLKITIWKYFNRAKFRATPFGTFASFGCTSLTVSSSPGELTLTGKPKLHRFTSWESKEKMATKFDELLRDDFMLFANSSFYKIGNAIRYLYFDQGEFELSEIEYSKEIVELLQQCLVPIKIKALLKDRPNDRKLLDDINFLLSIQLLLHSGQPNIIGEDFFSGLSRKSIPSDNDYIISERAESSKISQNCFRHIPTLIDCLQQLLPPSENKVLDDFIARFTRKFEMKEVPIMQALDPEAGIAYDNLATISGDNELIAELSAVKASSNASLKDTMIQSMLKASSGSKTTIDLEQLIPLITNSSSSIPNTFSLLCQTDGQTLLIDNIGGATANALNGRFSLASKETHSLCQQLAALEQEANPDVHFFDIGYMAEGYVDNINRRKAIYPLELNLLCYDTSKVPLALTDILLSVRGGALILRSKSLGKRLIPRFSTAYNYRRSDLPVFRLLCDLQHQKLTTNLNFSLRSLIPGLSFYPEVRFRNIIVSPRAWQLKATNGLDTALKLRHYLCTNIATRYVRTGRGDQTLYFDLHADADINVLLQLVLKEKELFIEQMPPPEQSIIRDQRGNYYSGQFQLNLIHHENIYKPALPLAKQSNDNCIEVFPPGGPWLYYEIYCHPYRADELLLDKLARLISAFEKQIRSWFFIRYNEGGDHIRLRLRLSDPIHSQAVTAQLSGLLTEEIDNGIVSDLRINLYRREIARYGADLMEAVEEHFSRDSLFVLLLLSEQPTDFTKYQLCIELLSLVGSSTLFTQEEFTAFIQRQSEAFSQEHQLKPDEYTKLNASYKQYRFYEKAPFSSLLTEVRPRLKASLLALLKKCPLAERAMLLSDLLHMHVNRLFAQQQRTHEMVIYYFALKELQRAGAFKKQAELHQVKGI